MNVDSYFNIGSTHKICQDYALHFANNDVSYALIGDGCSGAENTDFGSRLLVKSIEPLLKSKSQLIFENLTEAVAKNYILTKALGLNEDCLCSTILGVYEDENVFRTFMVGDGVFAAIGHDEQITVHEYEFKSGAPYYLYYELSPLHKDRYFKEFGKQGTQKIHKFDPKTGFLITTELPWSFDEDNIFFYASFSKEEYKAVAIMTDGVKSFIHDQRTETGRQGVPVPMMEVVKEVLAFKNYTGEFVQRRCIKAFKQFKTQDIQNTDDFSLAVLMKNQ